MSEALNKLVKEFENAVDNAPYRIKASSDLDMCSVIDGSTDEVILRLCTYDVGEELMTKLNCKFIIKSLIQKLYDLNHSSNKSYPILIEEILSANE